MIIFILIFFVAIIAVGAAAVFGFSFYSNRRVRSLQTKNQNQFTNAQTPPYRSLFEPDEKEIRAFELEEMAKTEVEKLEIARQCSLEKLKQVRELQLVFQENPNRKNIVNLLLSAVKNETAKTFSETAESVIKVWRENKIKNLTATDLADLLDSHLGLLSQQEKASGAIFWLKQEIAGLRRKTEGN